MLNYLLNLIKKFFKTEKVNIVEDTFCLWALIINLLLCVFSFLYVNFYLSYLPEQIPLWYSLPWGVYVIGTKIYLYILPSLMLFNIFLSGAFIFYFLNHNLKEISRFICSISFTVSLLLFFSVLAIVERSKMEHFVLGGWFFDYLVPAVAAFIISSIFVKLIIKYAHKLKVVEFPSLRDEPGKVLRRPTPRAGAVAFWIGFAVPVLFFLWGSQRALGLVLGTFITTLAGYLDDRFKLNFLPRLVVMLPLAIVIIVLSGFIMLYIPNPFGEVIKLDTLRYSFEFFGQHSIIVYGAIASVLWLVWISNMLSFNNGTDGQFVAISSVLALVIGILSLRFETLSYEQKISAQIAFITLGSILGLFKDTLPSNKIIWGWGATGVGLILGALSLLSGTRIATASLVLLIPSIDVLYVILNRIKNKKSPFLGDRTHLHHKLLDLGWSKGKIALFYWVVSIFFGALALMTSGRSKALSLIMISGVVLYALILVRKYVNERVLNN